MTTRMIVVSLLLCVVSFSAIPGQQRKGKKTMEQTSVRFINRAPAGYSHVVEVKGGRTLYVAGQVALDKSGNLVGRGDFRAQTQQVFENIRSRLEEVGASFKDVVKLNYYVTETSDLPALREVRDSFVNREQPPASTLVAVKRLVREEFMIEVEAIAVTAE